MIKVFVFYDDFRRYLDRVFFFVNNIGNGVYGNWF